MLKTGCRLQESARFKGNARVTLVTIIAPFSVKILWVLE
jgi:hypothetical protein